MALPEPSPVFEALWRFAAERQAIYERRLRCLPPPWTENAILGSFRFTNVFRASDRVSQYLIRDVIYQGDDSPADTVFRVLLFKFFNRIDTWQLLDDAFGKITLETFDPCVASALLSRARLSGRPVYSNAYIMPPVPRGGVPKHAGHLQLAIDLVEGGLAQRICSTSSLEDLFLLLRSVPGLGSFLAYQFAVDLCYSELVSHDEDEFVVAGPGAIDGLSKVFPDMNLRQAGAVIRVLSDEQEHWFDHFGLQFRGLFGRRLHLIDVQNLLCEISKYARVAYPAYQGVSGRARIKQRFTALGPLLQPFFPPKWALNTSTLPAASMPGSTQMSVHQVHLRAPYHEKMSHTIVGAATPSEP